MRVDRTADAIALLALIAKQNNVDVATLRSKEMHARAAVYVKIRRDFCVRGRAMGIMVIELGIALNRDHTTITYHASPDVRARKLSAVRIWKGRTAAQKHRRKLSEAGLLNSERAAFA